MPSWAAHIHTNTLILCVYMYTRWHTLIHLSQSRDTILRSYTHINAYIWHTYVHMSHVKTGRSQSWAAQSWDSIHTCIQLLCVYTYTHWHTHFVLLQSCATHLEIIYIHTYIHMAYIYTHFSYTHRVVAVVGGTTSRFESKVDHTPAMPKWMCTTARGPFFAPKNANKFLPTASMRWKGLPS